MPLSKNGFTEKTLQFFVDRGKTSITNCWQSFCLKWLMSIINIDKLIDPLTKELDLRARRNEMISSNVANVDTPGYKAVDLDFSKVLKDKLGQIALKQTDTRHMAGEPVDGGSVSSIESRAVGRPDGNNVQIEEEMLKLTRNNIEYNVLVQFVSKRLSGLIRNIESIK